MPDAKHIACLVVTPEAEVLREDAESVIAPAFDGQVGILPRHAPMVAIVGLGEMVVRAGGETHRLAVDGGLLTVMDDRVTVLADRALRAESIDAVLVAAEARALESAPAAKDEKAIECRQRDLAWNKLCAKISYPSSPHN
jgi:F-type H+-transporting ATPase subunit epsilon